MTVGAGWKDRRVDQSNNSGTPYGGRSREDYERLLLEKVSHEGLRLTLAFAGLFQLTHEMLKYAILDKVRGFYLKGFDDKGLLYDETAYQAQVLGPSTTAGRKANAFRGSFLWLVMHEAITAAEADRLDAIYEHRHELAHELGKFLVDVDHQPNVALFEDAASILRKIHRFWIDVELQAGGFFDPESGDLFDDVDAEEVTPLTLMLLQECVDAITEGIAEPNDE